MLQLTDLVKGKYIFKLTVTDNKGLTGTDSVTVNVKESKQWFFQSKFSERQTQLLKIAI